MLLGCTKCSCLECLFPTTSSATERPYHAEQPGSLSLREPYSPTTTFTLYEPNNMAHVLGVTDQSSVEAFPSQRRSHLLSRFFGLSTKDGDETILHLFTNTQILRALLVASKSCCVKRTAATKRQAGSRPIVRLRKQRAIIQEEGEQSAERGERHVGNNQKRGLGQWNERTGWRGKHGGAHKQALQKDTKNKRSCRLAVR